MSRVRCSGLFEEKDATPAERGLCEVNTGILAVSTAKLRGWVAELGNENAQGEYYLTDVVALAGHDGIARLRRSRQINPPKCKASTTVGN
jgi:bifunctional UDP-N-acetylglucosamine pyrophosphorylase/glucosamine-1-phosphate N-acetyltransferase